jgi:hypothetical protein
MNEEQKVKMTDEIQKVSYFQQLGFNSKLL